ncbi:MAG: MotA/TolQ/ExbB proton channel family protein [Planctomycetaceae bacterium]
MSNPTTRLKLVILFCGLLFAAQPLFTLAQESNAPQPASPVPPSDALPDETPLESATAGQASIWELAVQGGLFMIPIALASIIVLAFCIERYIGLRRTKIIPVQLITGLNTLVTSAGIDPKEAHRLCIENPSPLATALRAAILKIGRPQPEVEKAAEDAVGREATAMARNLRPVNVVASIGPLLGVMGTVQGMIMAFMVMSTTSSTGNQKAQELARGIYTALVTTFSGLFVAVLAIVLANMLEGKIEKLLKRMEDIFMEVVPLFERFEGRLRVNRTVGEDSVESLVLSRSSRKDAAERTGRLETSTTKPRPAAKPQQVSDRQTTTEDSKAPPASPFATATPTAINSDQVDAPSGVDGPRGLWDVMWENSPSQHKDGDVASGPLEINQDS